VDKGTGIGEIKNTGEGEMKNDKHKKIQGGQEEINRKKTEEMYKLEGQRRNEG
jgi:hypothetical protein